MSAENMEIVRRCIEELNKGNQEAFDRFYAAGWRMRDPAPNQAKDRDRAGVFGRHA